MISTILSALKEKEPLFRAHRLHELLSSLNSKELGGLFERTLQIKDRTQRETILGPLIARWEALDPLAAETAVQPFVERLKSGKRIDWGGADRSILEAWALARPELVLAAIGHTPNGNWDWLAGIALDATTQGGPAKKLEILSAMPATSLRGSLCEQALRELGKKDSAAAEAHLNLLTDVPQRERLQCAIIAGLAERDPAAALARVPDIAAEFGSGARSVQLVSEAFSKAAAKDPRAALAAAVGLPEELKLAASGAALVGWMEKSPREALDWARKNGFDLTNARASVSFGENGDSSWRPAMATAFDKDREGTLAWLREQPATPERDAMLADGIWSGSFEQRMAIYAELTPEGGAENIGRVISGGYKGSDVDAAEKFVQSLPAGPERIAAVEGLAWPANSHRHTSHASQCLP